MSTDPVAVSDSIREAIALSFAPPDRLHVATELASIRYLLNGYVETETTYGAILAVANGDIARFAEVMEMANDYRNIISLVSGYDFRYPDLSHMELIQRYRALKLPIPLGLKTFVD